MTFENFIPEQWSQPAWYALFVRSNQEKRVAQHLNGRDVEYFLPCYSSVSQWKDRRVKLEIPLFPGYLFVRLPLFERLKALTVPNVVSLVGVKDSPSPIADEEIEWIRRGIEQGKAEPHPYLSAGQRVMITQGVFEGMKGILLRKQNSSQLVVSVESICRSFTVEIDFECVKVLDYSLEIGSRHTYASTVALAN
jgi:transcription antitermination factor NusG